MAKEIARREALTAQELDFVRLVARRGDPAECVVLCGYAESDKNAVGIELLTQPRIALALQHEIRRQLVIDAPKSFRVLRELRDNVEISAKVRADCAKTLLDRAGHIAPKAVADKPPDTPLHEMTTDELRSMAARLEDEIAGRAKPVSSAIAAPNAADYVDLIG